MKFVFVSFDDRDTTEMAAAKKKTSLDHFRRPEPRRMAFLTGLEGIDRQRSPMPRIFILITIRNHNLFAHASGIMAADSGWPHFALLLWSGNSPPRLAVGLVDASQGKMNTGRQDAAVLFSVRSVHSAI